MSAIKSSKFSKTHLCFLPRWRFLTGRSSVKSTRSWRASGTLTRMWTKNIGWLFHHHQHQLGLFYVHCDYHHNLSCNDVMIIITIRLVRSSSQPLSISEHYPTRGCVNVKLYFHWLDKTFQKHTLDFFWTAELHIYWYIFRASSLRSTNTPRRSTRTPLTTRSWIGRITSSCGGKNTF